MIRWHHIAAFVLVGAIAVFGTKAHMARKADFMAACSEAHSKFECQYRWDTLMARERAANQTK